MATEEHTRIDDLPVTISIEVDRKSISIEDLSKLSKGSTVEFSKHIPNQVQVFANGAHFADATLIMIEDQVAVRIDKIIKT